MKRYAGATGVLILSVMLTSCSRPQPAPEPVRAVRTFTVVDGAAGGRIDYAGEVRARTESRLSFRVAGKMVSRPVELGDTVKPGQVLARLDPMDLSLGQQAAQSAVQAARIQAEQAGVDFRRFQELREQGFISAAELDRRESTFKAAQAQYEQARAQAGVQANQARYTTLVADAAGVVTAIEADPGTVLAVGAPVLRLAPDGPRDVVFSVPEHQAAGLRALEGQRAALEVRLWGQDGTPLPASVREVAAAADPATRTFLVKADVGRAPVRIGQTATVSLRVPGAPGTLRLPLAALFEQRGSSHVWLLDEATMTVRAQAVEVAGAEGNVALVKSGLSAGQTVISAGTHALSAGQKVTRYVPPGTPPQPAAAAASR